MPKRKKKATPSRRKPFIVFGRFDSTAGSHIEVWNGSARSMAVAMRRAIAAFWIRPAVKWKHFVHVNITGHADAIAERNQIVKSYKQIVKGVRHAHQ